MPKQTRERCVAEHVFALLAAFVLTCVPLQLFQERTSVDKEPELATVGLESATHLVATRSVEDHR